MTLRQVGALSTRKQNTTFTKDLCTVTLPQKAVNRILLIKQDLGDRPKSTRNIRQSMMSQLDSEAIGRQSCWNLPAIPKSARDTYEGSIVSVKHEIVVQMQTEGDYTNPEFVVPVRIVPGRASSSFQKRLSNSTASTASSSCRALIESRYY